MIRKNLCKSPPEFSPCPLFCRLFKRLITLASKHRSKISTSWLLLFFNYFSFPERDAKGGQKKKKRVFITYLSRVRCYSDAELSGGGGALKTLLILMFCSQFSSLLFVKLLLVWGVAEKQSRNGPGNLQNGIGLSGNY